MNSEPDHIPPPDDDTGPGELTDKERAFVREYPLDCNATKAAIRAGYAESGARTEGSRLLDRPRVQTALKGEFDRLKSHVQVTVERVVAELAHIAFVDPAGCYDQDGALLPISKMPEGIRRAVASIEENSGPVQLGLGLALDGDDSAPAETRKTRLKFHEKLRALQLLGNHLGMFTDKLQVGPSDSLSELLKMTRQPWKGTPVEKL
ncbi:MAG: terminase small subunit [Nitrospirota bacterium]|nr:terminase small subunit [Nitrospirota bacterium]